MRSPHRSISTAAPTPAMANLLLTAVGKAPLQAKTALGLLQAAYLNENLPEAMRLQAAAYAAPYEVPRLTAIAAQVALQHDFSADDPRDALVDAILRRAEVARKKHEPEREITPPPPTPAKHARRPPAIDGDEPLSHSQESDGEKAAEILAPDAAVPPVSAPGPETLPEKPVDADVIEVNIPTRSGWITRYVPRVK